jgi:hypothetical protein
MYKLGLPMNRTLILGFILLLTSIGHAQHVTYVKPGTDDSEYKYIIKANLLSPFVGTANFHFEINQGPNSSSQFEVFYFGGQYFGEPTGVEGIGVTYNYRYYLVGTFPSGVYVQPYARYQAYWDAKSVMGIPPITSNTGSNRVNVYGVGMVFGYQWVFAKRIALDVFLGPSYNKTYQDGVQVPTADVSPLFSGGFIRTGCAIGFVF